MRSSASSSSSLTASWSSALTNSTLKPNSSARRAIVSASSLWLIETKRPRFMHVEIISVTGTFIIIASSLAETNSVTFRIFLSCSILSSTSRCFWLTASLFSLLYLDPFDFPLVVSLASVSFICFCTSSSSTSALTGLFLITFLLILSFLSVWPGFTTET